MTDEQPGREQFGPVTVVGFFAEAVGATEPLVPKVVEGQTQAATAPGVAVVDGDEKKPAISTPPRMANDIIEAAVARSGRFRLQSPPIAVANDVLAQHRQKLLVERPDLGVDRFVRRAAQVRRDADAPAVELTLMEQPEPRREKRDGRRCPVLRQTERRRRAVRRGARGSERAYPDSRAVRLGGRGPAEPARRAGDRRAACRSSNRTLAAAVSIPGPNTLPP